MCTQADREFEFGSSIRGFGEILQMQPSTRKLQRLLDSRCIVRTECVLILVFAAI